MSTENIKSETDSWPKPQTVDVGSLARGSALQDFRSQVMGEWVDYYPKDGETCEYRIRGDEWIPCEIIREERRGPTQYLARYVSHTGQLKTGIVGSCNLRPSSPNTQGLTDAENQPAKPTR